MSMLQITEAFLKECPAWAKKGWQVGDVCDMCTLTPTQIKSLNAHPPHKPGTNG